MAKQAKAPAVAKVREMDPEWRIKFKSLKELEEEKRYSKSPDSKMNLPESENDPGA